jgi:hypothetical protein
VLLLFTQVKAFWRFTHSKVKINNLYTGRFIMFSVITDIYNNNNCSQPQENWRLFFFDN